ncbi:MAG: GTP-binding protein [Pseudomonadota bacterium]
MKEALANLAPIPTNLITGFLGVGKTSAILHLLSEKPAEERWAVLINEFGEIGIDGSLVAGQRSVADGVYISEVPGGCMCCTAGLPMQIALNELLKRAEPDRLLVEPTGLGHPREVLQTLSLDAYRGRLSLQKSLTLVDARRLVDDRYIAQPTFLQQLEVADVVVANKADLYSDTDHDNFDTFIGAYCRPETEHIVTSHGVVSPECLRGATTAEYGGAAHRHAESAQVLATDLPMPACGYVSAVNSGEGFESIGWRFQPGKVFDRRRLVSFLRGLKIERMKAVFITDDGIFAYNMTTDALQEVELDDCLESRVEMIAAEIDAEWENTLLSCLA